jgi:hypothetical protein
VGQSNSAILRNAKLLYVFVLSHLLHATDGAPDSMDDLPIAFGTMPAARMVTPIIAR